MVETSDASESVLCPFHSNSFSRPHAKRVTFGSIDVFYFERTQGFVCIPSHGGSTLGMAYKHVSHETLSVPDHQIIRQLEQYCTLMKKYKFHLLSLSPRHLEYVKERIRSAPRPVLNRILAYPIFRSLSTELNISSDDLTNPTPSLPENCADVDSQLDWQSLANEELEIEINNMMESSFLEILTVRKRRSILRKSGLQTIDRCEHLDCQFIRASRESCGCNCPDGVCNPETCSCAINGIACQVDRPMFPCSCGHVESCLNPAGRVEFDPVRVRIHYLHTKMRLDMAETECSEGEPSAKRLMIEPPEFNSTEQGSCRACVENRFTHLLIPSADNPSGSGLELSEIMLQNNNNNNTASDDQLFPAQQSSESCCEAVDEFPASLSDDSLSCTPPTSQGPLAPISSLFSQCNSWFQDSPSSAPATEKSPEISQSSEDSDVLSEPSRASSPYVEGISA